MAFYIRIRDDDRGIDIKSHRLPFLVFVTERYMLETLDECYDFVVSATEKSTINIFEKELLKRQCVGACYKVGNLVMVIMANDKFDNVSIQKLIVRLKRQYSPNFTQKELDDFTKDNQEVKPDKLDLIHDQLGEIKEIMIQNIDDILKRGESIESLTKKSEHLKDEATKFERKTRKLNSICSNCVLL